MTARLLALLPALLVLGLLPLLLPDYFLHIAVQVLLWGFVYTAWSLMGRYGLVSLGHGAFLGIGGYGPALLWNLYDVTPWLGIPVSVALAALLALVVGYPATRMRVVGHYYALVTLALSQVVALTIIALRDITGGSLGMTPRAAGFSWYALQFPAKHQFYLLAFVVWLAGLGVWIWADRGMGSKALEAINEDEGAVAAVGVSLQIVFAAIAGGMYSLLGPTVGALFTLVLTEGLRIYFGTSFIGAANTIYGVLLVLFIIFMPRGILGLIERLMTRSRRTAAAE